MDPKYVSADQAQLESGQLFSSVMRPRNHLTGVVVPPANDGVPVGFSPHNLDDVVVTIDPQFGGGRLRLGDLTKEAVNAASSQVDETDEFYGSTVMQRLASGCMAHKVASDSGDNGSAAHRQETFSVPNTSAPPVANVQDVKSPQISVVFEMEGFGEHRPTYHDVVVESGFMILVYDTRYPGDMYEPPVGGSGRLAAAVVGGPDVYLVHPTGCVFTYGCYRFCVLAIDKIAPLEGVE